MSLYSLPRTKYKLFAFTTEWTDGHLSTILHTALNKLVSQLHQVPLSVQLQYFEYSPYTLTHNMSGLKQHFQTFRIILCVRF